MTSVNGLLITDPCRLGIKPGFQNPVGGGQGTATPVILAPSDVSGAKPPFDPPVIVDPPLGTPGDPGPGVPGTGGPGTGGPSGPTTVGPTTGGPSGPTTVGPSGPTTGGPSGPTTVGPTTVGPSGPTTGGPSGPTTVGPSGPTTGGPTGIPVGRLPVIPQVEQPNTPNQEPTTGIPVGRLPVIPQVEQSNEGYVTNTLNKFNSVAEAQAITNSQQVSVNESLANIVDPKSLTISNPIYDPQQNFFRLTQTENIKSVSNGSYLNLFRSSVAEEVYSMFFYQQGNTKSWDEKAIQNLTDSKIIFSLNERLLEAFNNLRDVTGKQIGLSVFVNVIKKHLVTGTLNEVNYEYYLDAYNTQKNSKFTTLLKSDSEGSNELFSLLYLREGQFNLGGRKETFQKQIEMGRFRFLNEDLGLNLTILKSDGATGKLAIPNNGFPITYLNAGVAVSTTPAVGSTNLLNIGNGGGYYIQSQLSEGEQKPILLESLVSSTYYAPPSVRSSLLELTKSSYEYEITAESLSNKNEFVSGDLGPSALTPLYFGIELNSARSVSFNETSVENYSATYSRITNSDDIQQHLNNNALSVPQLYVDYRDPIYRYILDTSSFSLKSSDISNKGFASNPTLLREDNFIKNIPFGFVIVPSQGSNFNPFNGRSRVTSLSDTVTRSLAVKPSINNGITSTQKTGFDFYNLFLEDGSERVGSFEDKSVHNFGYKYDPSKFYNTFYVNGNLGSSPPSVSSYGSSYLVKDVLDYIKDTYDPESVVWFDVFSRMPLSRVGELMYDLPDGFLELLKNGYRHGIKIKNAQRNPLKSVTLLAEDSKTIVKSSTRPTVELIDR